MKNRINPDADTGEKGIEKTVINIDGKSIELPVNAEYLGMIKVPEGASEEEVRRLIEKETARVIAKKMADLTDEALTDAINYRLNQECDDGQITYEEGFEIAQELSKVCSRSMRTYFTQFGKNEMISFFLSIIDFYRNGEETEKPTPIECATYIGEVYGKTTPPTEFIIAAHEYHLASGVIPNPEIEAMVAGIKSLPDMETKVRVAKEVVEHAVQLKIDADTDRINTEGM